MLTEELRITNEDLRKLIGAASGDAALMYLYLKSGADPAAAGRTLRLTDTRASCATATLRQLGLWQEERHSFIPGERPGYSEQDVISAVETDTDFRGLYGEVQRLLGRNLNTEEMKIILGFVRYLGLPADVVIVLVCYCKERARLRGQLRNPSLRTIEKEAYAWAEQGIDTMEEASAFIQAQTLRSSQLGQIMRLLQIRGRNLTAAEERYARQWLADGFAMDAIAIAYERTCLNTGSLNWAYMNKILQRWKEAGLLTAEQIKSGDRKPAAPVGAAGGLGEAEIQNIKRMLEEK